LSLSVLFNLNRMKKDLQDKADTPLIDTAGECSQALFNLVLFGAATPYLHNGTLTIEDDNGEVKALPFIMSHGMTIKISLIQFSNLIAMESWVEVMLDFSYGIG